MDKKTLTLIGVAGLALAALYIWSKGKQKKDFANRRGLPYGTVSAGPSAGQVVFFGPRGSVYLPAGTVPYQISGIWYFTSGGGEILPLTGPGALNQTAVNSAL
jgi:hypothetical protein